MMFCLLYGIGSMGAKKSLKREIREILLRDGTDGRPIIYKNTNVTGRRKRPVMFFLKGTTLLSSWIDVGIFWARSDDE
jgi:hypothetical protein